MKYPTLEDNAIERPSMRDYDFACCDCGLVHRLDFFIVKHGRGQAVKFRIRRNRRATAAMRRHMKTAKRRSRNG